jgi:hypothetical protein
MAASVPAHSEGLVVSVPEGGTATLRVTDEGRTQSYDLRAGERGPDAIAGYYRPQNVTIPSSLCCGVHGRMADVVRAARTVGVTAGFPWTRTEAAGTDGPRTGLRRAVGGVNVYRAR